MLTVFPPGPDLAGISDPLALEPATGPAAKVAERNGPGFEEDDAGRVARTLVDGITETPNPPTLTVQSGFSIAAVVLPPDVEQLILLGSDDIDGTGNELDNLLSGNDGDNVLSGLGGDDILRGGFGRDTLIGGGGRDTLYGNSGGDALYGGNRSDMLYGGSGWDFLDGGSAPDLMDGGSGNDVYRVDNPLDRVIETGTSLTEIDTVLASISYVLGPNVERLTLEGSAPLTGTGNALDNLIIGNAGHNRLDGGRGDDTLEGGAGSDRLSGGRGNDTLVGGVGYDRLFGGEGNDRLDGASGNDALFGGSGDDVLLGGSRDDALYGDDGDDILDGGLGADLLTGGEGRDTFLFTAFGVANADRATDFTPAAGIGDFLNVSDIIQLSSDVFSAIPLSLGGNLGASAFHVGASATSADHRIVYDIATGTLDYDADGSGAGAAQRIAVLNPGLTFLGEDDIFVV